MTRRVCVCINLFMVYLSWGGLYLANRYAVETIPPFLMCGVRMGTAGFLMYGFTMLRGERGLPSATDLLHGGVVGFFMIFLGGGMLAWGQQSVTSGTAALIIGTAPIWMVLGGRLLGIDPPPSGRQLLGLAGGFAGLTLLGLSNDTSGGNTVLGLLGVFTATLGWVAGSLFSKCAGRSGRISLIRFSAWVLMNGGVQCLVCGLIVGEWAAFHPEQVTLQSFLGLAYNTLMGGIAAYVCYFWLLANTSTATAISYEYVVPVIAVFLGWLVAGEKVDALMICACILTVGSVFLFVSRRG